MKNTQQSNFIFCGDNLSWLAKLPDSSIDLCYIDPPFFTNRLYEVIWGNGAEIRSFGDRFSGGIAHYIEWMRPRLEAIHAKIKSSGSIFLHCDWHASHRLRCLLDEIFVSGSCQSVIQWKRTKNKKNNYGQGKSGFETNCDTILHYSKGPKPKFFPVYTDYSKEYTDQFYKYTEEQTGRRYRLGDLAGPGGASNGNPLYEVMGVKRHWRYSEKRMAELIEQGRIVQLRPGAVPAFKRYLDEGKGVPVQSLWEDIHLEPKENLGYPTQKPESLLRRIISCSTEKGDRILDCFAGGGVTAKVAAELGRSFVVGDVSPVAIRVIATRLNRSCKSIDFEILGLPTTESDLKLLNGHQFSDLVCKVMGWKSNVRKSGDGGVDGWDGHGHPIQVKNHAAPIGRPDLQRFAGALLSASKDTGIFVSWGFSRQAIEYIAEVRRIQKLQIKLVSSKDVFKGLLIDEQKQLEFDELFAKRVPPAWNAAPSIEEHEDLLAKANLVKEKLSAKKTVIAVTAK